MIMENKSKIDPELNDDELINVEDIPQEEQDEIKSEIEDDEEDRFFDNEDEDDSEDEDDEEKKKPGRKRIYPKKEVKHRDIEEQIKILPEIGQTFSGDGFLIDIIGKNKEGYLCKVIWSHKNCKRIIGDKFTAKEIAFYSTYYTLVK